MSDVDHEPAPPVHGLNVDELLASSMPVPTPMLAFLPIGGMICLTAAVATAALTNSPLGLGIALGLLFASIGTTVYMARLATAARDERRQVRQIDELVTLRCWPEAAAELNKTMSKPMRLLVSRRGLMSLLVRVVNRYGDDETSIELTTLLADDERADASTRFAARCGLAVLLLRTHRLGEANDVIDRLRSDVRRMRAVVARTRPNEEDADTEEPEPELDLQTLLDAEEGSESPPPAQQTSPEVLVPAPLLLAEMYRDIQTNHNAEAVETFVAHREVLRRQLGLRLGDALALASLAADRLGQTDDAEQWWGDATCLTPANDVVRRYPELAAVAQKYPAIQTPVSGENAGVS